VDMSVYSDAYEFYANEKGSERHHHMLLNQLDGILSQPKVKTQTKTYTHLHLIAEKLKRRSLVFLFTDMFQSNEDEDKLFDALRHLKHNKHEVILFHTYDSEKELQFDFDNRPKRYVDVETGEHINLYADSIKDNYKDAVSKYFNNLRLKCIQYQIKYVTADTTKDFNRILTTYLVERQKFV